MPTPVRIVHAPRALIAALAMLVVAAFLALGLSAPAQAAGVGTLKVRVVSATGTPISGLSGSDIQAVPIVDHRVDSFSDFVSGKAVSGKPGTYSFAVQAGRDYTIQVVDAPGAYPQLFGDTAFYDAAKTVSVADGATTTLDFSVDTNVTISGTVTGPTNKAVKGIHVDAWRFDGTTWIDGWATATTGSKGTYSLTDLDPGSYKLQFSDTSSVGYLTEFSGDAKTLAAATAVYVGVGGAAKSSAKLAGGGRISGTVTYTYKGKTIGADLVLPVAYPVTTDGVGGLVVDKGNRYFGADTGSTGKWSVPALPAGRYIVKLFDDTVAGTNYSLTDSYVGISGPVTHALSAQVFTVATGKTITRSAAIKLPLESSDTTTPTFSLTVTDSASAPVVGADVRLASADGDDYSFTSTNGVSSTETDAAGVLAFPRLQSGDYTLTVTKLDADGAHPILQPLTRSFSYSTASPSLTLSLDPLTALGWNSAPTIASPQFAVGLSNTVSVAANQSGADLSYEWLRDGAPIFGATNASYTSTSGDLGSVLSVVVFAAKSGLDSVSGVATVGTIVAGPQITAGATGPSISPITSQPMGTTLSASPGNWSVPGAKYTIGWYSSADGYTTALATGPTYTTTAAVVDDTIRVQVVASKPGYTPSIARYSAVVAVTLAPAAKLVTSPKVTFSSKTNTYSVTAGTWSPATTQVDYSWELGGDLVSEDTFLNIANPDGKPITVTVAAHRAGFAASAPVKLVAFRGTAVPTAIGTDAGALVSSPGGDPISDASPWGTAINAAAQPATWTYADTSTSTASTYQWYVGTSAKHTAISGATKATFTPTSGYLGKTVYLQRTSASAEWAAASIRSALVTITPNRALVDGVPVVAISGTRAHSTLTVTVGSWSGATVTRQWMSCNPVMGSCDDPSDYSPISKATAASYAASYGQYGLKLLVKAAAKKTGYVSGVAYSVAVTLDRGLAVKTASPKLTTAEFSYTVSTGSWTPGTADSDTVSYQWYLDGKPVGQNGPTPDVWQRNQADQPSKSLYVVVTYAPADATVAPASTTVIVRNIGPKPTTTAPTFHGATFGDSFSIAGDPFVYLPSGLAHTLSYAWSVGGKVVAGATAATYTPTVTAIGKTVSLTVTSRAVGFADGSYTTAPVTLAAAAGATGNPTITSTTDAPRPASVLTADTGAISTGATLGFQWESRRGASDFAAISGATASTYRVPTTAPGSDLRVVVTAKQTGHLTATLPSAQVTVALGLPIAATSDPSISGTGAVGSKLTASLGTWNTAGLTFGYQWMRDSVAIPGATASTFTPLASSLGDDVWVVVTASRAGYEAASAASSRVTVTVGATLAASTLPKITGTPLIDSTLTVSTGTWNVAGLAFAYQWYLGDAAHPIDGATSNSYVPTDAPSTVFAVVTATRSGYADGSATSAKVSIRTQ